MALSLINDSAADRLVGALCNTLMHSLWQGILLAAVAGIIVICTRKASSALRYNLLISALVLFAVGVSVTFVWQYQKGPGTILAQTIMQPYHADKAAVINNNSVTPAMPIAQVMQPMPAPQVSFTDRVSGFMNDHHNTIVLIWFLIICARSLQLGVGLYGTYRLRRVHVFAVKNHWPERMQHLADALGIKQTITLLESGLAKVPMVIGHLKPVVLVPIGLLTALSAEEVEAILIHELAHIKRRDYLVNMLQSLMEIVFFFNPAVLWISKLIKTERENCCDDLALAQNNNKVNYIRALVSCEEYQSSVPAYAMAFPGGKSRLLDRVKRMASNRNHSLNTFEKTVLAMCLVVLGLGVSAFTAREDIKKAVKSIAAAIHHNAKPVDKVKTVKRDTTKKKQVEANNDVNQLLNKLTQLHPDTFKTANSPEVKALIFKIDSLRLNAQQSGLNANLSGLNGNLQPLSVQGKADSLMLKLLNNKTYEKQLFNLKPDTSILNKLRQTSAIGQELYREHLITDTNHLNVTTNLDKRELIVNGVRMPDDVYQRIYTKFYKKGESGNYKSNAGSGRSYQYYASQDWAARQRSQEIGYELLRDNLVKDPSHFTYKLSKDGLDVDGEKQPDDIFRRIVDKYFKPGDDFNLNYTYHDPGSVNDSLKMSVKVPVRIKSGYGDASADPYANASANYSANASKYNPNESQQKYWAGQQRKIIDQMQREGLIVDRKDISFTLTDKTFVINGLVQNGEVFQRYHQEYVPASAKDNWTWSYNGPGAGNPPNAADRSNWRGRDWDAYSRQMAADRQRVEAERDKKLVAELMQDGLITGPNNVKFELSDKGLKINGKKQSDELYQKYKDEYMPGNTSSGWSWTYSHHE